MDSQDLQHISNANTLIDAFDKAKDGSIWKASVQRYEINLLRNVAKTQEQIRAGTYEQMPFYEFELSERGKVRPIKSQHVSDRIVQRATCDNVITPALSNYIIYDNSASIVDRGISLARKRVEVHIHRYYRQYKSNEGYILQIDFKKFFDNIQHDKVKAAFAEKIKDKEMMQFISKLIDAFQIDVSYMTDEQYENALNEVFDSLKYRQIPNKRADGSKMLKKSAGIGEQISQNIGTFFPTPIDNYCKIVKGLKYYARYMDDIYIIHPDKEYLRQLLKEIETIAKDLGLIINWKKTQISKLSKGFTFLKIKYRLTDTGHIVRRLSRDAITRERRRLKKYARLHDAERITYPEIKNAYNSWRGNVEKFDSRRSVRNLDLLFDDLYIKPFIGGAKQ